MAHRNGRKQTRRTATKGRPAPIAQDVADAEDNHAEKFRTSVTLIEGCRASQMVCAAHWKGDHWELQRFNLQGNCSGTSTHATTDDVLDAMERLGVTDVAAMGDFRPRRRRRAA